VSIEPVIDYEREGLRHRKWVTPARLYGNGGMDAEHHVYSVGDNPYAVSFTVHTGRYPEGRAHFNKRPSAVDMAKHTPGETISRCVCLSGASCTTDGTYFGASEWWASQPKDADGFVADDLIFDRLRSLYVEWK
jgi:hypothetical protein